jgi:peptidoglycan/xylan/chitin deacetylase (PgdA/CDA1 family)
MTASPSQAAFRRTLRTLARRGRDTAAGVLAPRVFRARAGNLAVLMYHRVLPRDDPRHDAEQPGMLVTPETLALHLSVLQRHFCLVSLGDWLAGRIDRSRPCCAITFDDGWHDNHEYAWPVLRRAGAPATIFLVSDLIGSTSDFWPGRLLRLLERVQERGAETTPALDWLDELCPGRAAPTTPDERAALIESAKRWPDLQILAWLEAGEAELGMTPEPAEGRALMDWDEVGELAASGLIEFGSHGRRHLRLLDSLNRDDMWAEIAGSADRIEHRLGQRPRVFCYPNGDACEAADAMVRRCYTAAVTTRRGWNPLSADRYRLARTAVHEDVSSSRPEFRTRLAGGWAA